MPKPQRGGTAESHGDLDAQELYAFARIDLEKGNLEDALRKLKQVLAADDPIPEALPMAARIYAQLRLPDRAKDFFGRYLAGQPDAIDELFQLGMVNFDSGDAPVAMELWAKVLRLQPTHPPALFFSALTLVNGDQAAQARRLLDILLQSAAADNLYFNKAKELLQAIAAGAAGRATEVPAISAGNPYGGEH